MAKYRLLTNSELQELEKEFVQYLIMNGITAEDWKKLKSDSPDRAEDITNLFSDVVFEKILRSVKFMKLIGPNFMNCMQCLDDKIVLYSLKIISKDVNLRDLENWASLKGKGTEIIFGERKYSDVREMDLFSMISEGAEISDGHWFKRLSLAYAEM